MSASPEAPEISSQPRPPGSGIATTALIVLALVAVFFALFVARVVFLPIAIASVATLLLRPLVRGLERLRIPEAIGAALVVGVAMVGLFLALQVLVDPAREILRSAPGQLRRIEVKVRELRRPLEDVNRAAEQAERIARGAAPDATTVVVEDRSLADSLALTTRSALAEIGIAVFLTYFLLSSGQAFLDKLARVVRDPALALDLRNAALEIERELTRYLVTVTLINALEGTLIGLVAWWIGLSNPVLWGIVAALVNFVPYLGPIGGCAAMTLAALGSLPIERALLVPLAYLVISSLEGYALTPLIVGRRLRLDPVAVFLGVLFWGWMWGVAGTVLAVPILAATKIACDRFERLAPVAELLGRQRPAPKGA